MKSDTNEFLHTYSIYKNGFSGTTVYQKKKKGTVNILLDNIDHPRLIYSAIQSVR